MDIHLQNTKLNNKLNGNIILKKESLMYIHLQMLFCGFTFWSYTYFLFRYNLLSLLLLIKLVISSTFYNSSLTILQISIFNFFS